MPLFFFVKYSRVCNTNHSIHSHSTSSQSFLCIFLRICILVFSLALPYSHWFETKPCSPFACKAPAIHPGEGKPSEAAKPCRGCVLLFHSWTEQRLLQAKESMEKSTRIPLFSAVSKYTLLVWLPIKIMSWIWKWTLTLLLWKGSCFLNHH